MSYSTKYKQFNIPISHQIKIVINIIIIIIIVIFYFITAGREFGVPDGIVMLLVMLIIRGKSNWIIVIITTFINFLLNFL